MKNDLNRDNFFADYLGQDEIPMEGVKFWFHGTDRESALNIIREGIYVRKGKKGMDFSDGNGFYLTRYLAKLFGLKPVRP